MLSIEDVNKINGVRHVALEIQNIDEAFKIYQDMSGYYIDQPIGVVLDHRI